MVSGVQAHMEKLEADLLDSSQPPRLVSLSQHVEDHVTHLRSAGAFFSSHARCAMVREAHSCHGACAMCIAIKHSEFNEPSSPKAFCEAVTKGHSSSVNPLLPSELVAAIHTIINLQNKCDRTWFDEILVPAAAACSRAQSLAAYGSVGEWGDDDNMGAAIEVLAVTSFSASLLVLELAGGDTSLRSSHRFLPAAQETDNPPLKGCRTTACASSLTRDFRVGFAPFATNDNLREAADLQDPPQAQALQAILAAKMRGVFSFYPGIPFKALSAVPIEYAFAFSVLENLYLPIHLIIQPGPGRGDRRGLKRAQMEVLAGAFAGASACAY